MARQLVYAPKYELFVYDAYLQTEVLDKPELIVDITDDCQNVKPGNRFVLSYSTYRVQVARFERYYTWWPWGDHRQQSIIFEMRFIRSDPNGCLAMFAEQMGLTLSRLCSIIEINAPRRSWDSFVTLTEMIIRGKDS